MQNAWIFAVILVGFCGGNDASSVTDLLDSSRLTPLDSYGGWRSERMCGPNSLYGLLRLKGLEVSLDDVVRQASPGANGVSFAQLQHASGEFGIRCEVVRFNRNQLSSLNFPVIVHFADDKDGHFSVALGLKNQAFWVIFEEFY
jgi:ABC-type bacteriocin/lantibiotic exporter with double-glycine peptidase domain